MIFINLFYYLVKILFIETIKLWTKSYSFLGRFNKLFEFLLCQESCFFLSDNHKFNVLVTWFDNVQQCLDHQLYSLIVCDTFLVMLLQILTHLLWVSPTCMSPPFWKWTWGVCVIKMGLSVIVKACNQSTDAERSDTTLLSVLLLCLCDVLWDVFDWWVIVVVQSVRLALDSCLVGEDSSVGCETWKGHVNMLVELDDFLNSSALL